DSIGDVVQLQIEEPRQSEGRNLVDALGPIRREKLQAELQPAGMPLDCLGKFLRLREVRCVNGDLNRAAHNPSSAGDSAGAGGAAGTGLSWSSDARRRFSRQILPRMTSQVGRNPIRKVMISNTGILMSACRLPHRSKVTSRQFSLAMIATKAAITTQNRVRRNCIGSPFAGRS